jgi:hypothetical protein
MDSQEPSQAWEIENCRSVTSASATEGRLMYMPPPSPAVTEDQRPEAGHVIGDLFRVHGPSLVRLALLLVGDRPRAEDVVQEAFMGLHTARLRDHDKALPYLRVAVVNGCRSVHQKCSTATGRLIKVLASATARALDLNGYLASDPSGRHLLLLGFGNHNTAVLDVATHRLSVVPVHYRYPSSGAGW